MQTIGFEGRTFVVSSNQVVRDDQLPDWINENKREGSILAAVGLYHFTIWKGAAGPSWTRMVICLSKS